MINIFFNNLQAFTLEGSKFKNKFELLKLHPYGSQGIIKPLLIKLFSSFSLNS